MTEVFAYLGLGANLGDVFYTLRAAIDAIKLLPQTRVLSISSFYSSAPIGNGADGPNYTNAVAKIITSLTPHDLLDGLQAIEHVHGRQRSHRNAARTLDLDILLYDNVVFSDGRLTVPHPRMTERAFVLLPLAEIDLNLTWINSDKQQESLLSLLPQVAGQDIVRL